MITPHEAKEPLDPKVPLLDHVTMSNQLHQFIRVCPFFMVNSQHMSKEIINSILRRAYNWNSWFQLGLPASAMNLLEKVGHFISKRGDYIQEQISGKRVFSAHVTNATDEATGADSWISAKAAVVNRCQQGVSFSQLSIELSIEFLDFDRVMLSMHSVHVSLHCLESECVNIT